MGATNSACQPPLGDPYDTSGRSADGRLHTAALNSNRRVSKFFRAQLRSRPARYAADRLLGREAAELSRGRAGAATLFKLAC